MFGSDRPVSEATGDYAAVLDLVQRYFADRGQTVFDKVLRRNAAKFYGIAEPKGTE